MTKTRGPFHNDELHVELMSIVQQYTTGLITDIELLQCCQTLQDLYAKLDVTQLYDGSGIQYTSNPFATKE
jgi:hypothetical protein